jgi:hypothetical protein
MLIKNKTFTSRARATPRSHLAMKKILTTPGVVWDCEVKMQNPSEGLPNRRPFFI